MKNSNPRQILFRDSTNRIIEVPLLSIFLFNFNHYLAIPLLGTIAEQSMEKIALSLATVLSVKSISENGIVLYAGYVSDKLSAQKSHLIGTLFRFMGFSFVTYNFSFIGLLLFGLLIGGGSAFCRAPSRTILSESIDYRMYEKVFRWAHIAMNAGAIGGPLLSYLVGNSVYMRPALVTLAFTELLLSFVQFLLIKPIFKKETETKINIKSLIDHLKQTLIVPSIKGYLLLQSLFWFLIGTSVSLIISVKDIYPDFSWVKGYLFSTEGIGTVFFQIIFVKVLKKNSSSVKFLKFGFFILCSSLLVFLINGSLHILFLSMIFFSFGDAIVGPYLLAQIAYLTEQNHINSSFSSLFFAEGIGEALGYYFGVLLLNIRHVDFAPILLMGTATLGIQILVKQVVKSRELFKTEVSDT